MKKSFFILMLLNGIASCLDAQNVFPPIEKCDSIEINCIYPYIMTVVNLHEENFEQFFERTGESNKRHVLVTDSVCIRNILDSVYIANPIEAPDDIDVRGRLTFFSSNGEHFVFYVGVCRLSFKGIVYNATPFAFQLLYRLFNEGD